MKKAVLSLLFSITLVGLLACAPKREVIVEREHGGHHVKYHGYGVDVDVQTADRRQDKHHRADKYDDDDDDD